MEFIDQLINHPINCANLRILIRLSLTKALLFSYFSIKTFWILIRSAHNLCFYEEKYPKIIIIYSLITLVLLNLDIPCLCKQCRSRSVGFFRSQLIWICTVCHYVNLYQYPGSSNLTGGKYWNGCGILIYSAGQGLSPLRIHSSRLGNYIGAFFFFYFCTKTILWVLFGIISLKQYQNFSECTNKMYFSAKKTKKKLVLNYQYNYCLISCYGKRLKDQYIEYSKDNLVRKNVYIVILKLPK